MRFVILTIKYYYYYYYYYYALHGKVYDRKMYYTWL